MDVTRERRTWRMACAALVVLVCAVAEWVFQRLADLANSAANVVINWAERKR